MKRAILKRTADALEKLAIASTVMAIYDGNRLGIVIAGVCMTISYILTVLEAKK